MTTTRKFGEVTLEIHDDHVKVDYGPSKGWEKFPREWDALEKLDDWTDKEISRLATELAGIAKLRRYIRRNLGGRQ